MRQLDRVKGLLAELPEEDRAELIRFLGDLPAAARPGFRKTPLKSGGHVRAEYVRCGKDRCRCLRGPGHGPYLYRYWREDGRLRKRYLGIAPRVEDPDDL